jgi:methyl-accepting chemotaxis protein
MKDIKEIERLVAEINRSASEMRKSSKKVKSISDDQLPSNFNLMLSGITDSKSIQKLFSTRLDVLIDNMMNLALSGDLMGNIEKFVRNEDELKRFLDSLGFGKGSFEGPVSTTILNTVRDSVESMGYLKLDSDAKRVEFVYKKLRMKWWSFWNKPELRRKYEQAMTAITKILEVVAKIYRNREKIIKGLGNIVTESIEVESLSYQD